MNPKVTLAVSVYNVAPYIERCVRSLFEQTFTDIEFLFIDDCTPDNSMDIMRRVLEDYPSRKPQVKVVRHEHNMGTAATKRDCYLQSMGDYVLVIDSDDFIELDTVEKMYQKAQEHDADMVVCDMKKYHQMGYKIISVAPNGVTNCGENVKDDIINRYVTPSLSCKMIMRSLFSANEIVWPSADFTEDYVISVQAAYYAQRIAFVNEPLYHYCFNQESFSRTRTEGNKLKIYNDFMENFNIVLQFIKDKNVEEKYENGIFLNKIRAKSYLLPLFPKRKYRKMWVKTFPEVNHSFLFGDKHRKPSYRERFWMIAMSIGLYPRFKRIIYSKRLRPRPGWQPIWT